MVISASLSLPLSLRFSVSFFLPLSLPICLSFFLASRWYPPLLLVLPCPPRARETLFTVSLSIPAYSPQPPSHPTRSLPRSLGEAYASRHFSYSVVLSSAPFPSPLTSSFYTLFLRCLSSSLCLMSSPRDDSLSLSFSRSLSRSLLTQLFAHLYLCPPFSLLVCFPLPVGNCTLSLLPGRRFPLVRVCRCSPIRFRVFCSPPPPSSSYDLSLSLALFRSVSCPRSLSSALAGFFTTGLHPRVRQKEGDPGRRHRFAPGRASNLIIRRLIIRERDENYASTIIFSRELSFPLYRRLNATLDCAPRAHSREFYAESNVALFVLLYLIYLISSFPPDNTHTQLDVAGGDAMPRSNCGLN